MSDEKTLKWQYIGIIICVVILLTLAIVSSFAFAVSDNVSVAEAYYSPSGNYVDFHYYYLASDVSWQFQYGDMYDYSYSLSDFQSLLRFDDEFYDYVDAECAIPLRWTVSLYVDSQVQTSPQTYFEFSVGTYSNFDSEIIRYHHLIANEDNGYSLSFDCWGTDLYFDIEFRDSSAGEDWCIFYIDEIEVSYILDERSWINGYNRGVESGYEGGYYAGYQDGYQIGQEETSDIYYDYGYNVGFGEGKNVGYHDGYNDGYTQAGVEGVDYSWQGLVSAIIDVPVRTLVGKWTDANGDGQYELVGGLFNFYIPELNLNLAPILLSMITICVIVVILRFVFQFL